MSWTPSGGLGRPLDGSVKSALAVVARRFAGERDATVLDRMLAANQAVGQTLVERAFTVMLDGDPPPPHELAGMVARGQARRLRLP